MKAPLRAGVGIFALAGLLDIAIHLTGGSPAWETPAHVATLAGMVATLGGVVGTRASFNRPNPPHKEIRDAIR